jgi:uncharacterized protein YoxC
MHVMDAMMKKTENCNSELKILEKRMNALSEHLLESEDMNIPTEKLYPLMSEIYGMSVAIQSFKDAIKQCESCTVCDDEET